MNLTDELMRQSVTCILGQEEMSIADDLLIESILEGKK